jgi:hypothetical protein
VSSSGRAACEQCGPSPSQALSVDDMGWVPVCVRHRWWEVFSKS